MKEQTQIVLPSWVDICRHSVSFWWKLIFSPIPAPTFLKGFVTTLISLAIVMGISVIMYEFTWLLSCNSGVPSGVGGLLILSMAFGYTDSIATPLNAAKRCLEADDVIGHVPYANWMTVSLGLGVNWVVGGVVSRVRYEVSSSSKV